MGGTREIAGEAKKGGKIGMKTTGCRAVRGMERGDPFMNPVSFAIAGNGLIGVAQTGPAGVALGVAHFLAGSRQFLLQTNISLTHTPAGTAGQAIQILRSGADHLFTHGGGAFDFGQIVIVIEHETVGQMAHIFKALAGDARLLQGSGSAGRDGQQNGGGGEGDGVSADVLAGTVAEGVVPRLHGAVFQGTGDVVSELFHRLVAARWFLTKRHQEDVVEVLRKVRRCRGGEADGAVNVYGREGGHLVGALAAEQFVEHHAERIHV